MSRKPITIFSGLLVIFVMAACSSLNIPGLGAANTQANQNNPASAAKQAQNLQNQPIENKLALGILQLEGTDNAVTKDQAKTLLPLWKAVKTLEASSNTSKEEISAVYTQIQEALTEKQLQAIKDVNFKPEEFQALMEKYGVKFTQGERPNLTQEQIATRQAQRAANGGTQGGGFAGGGFQGGPPPDGVIIQRGDGNFQAVPGQQNAQGTPQPNQQNRVFRGGLNNLFVEPVIKLLEERAGS